MNSHCFPRKKIHFVQFNEWWLSITEATIAHYWVVGSAIRRFSTEQLPLLMLKAPPKMNLSQSLISKKLRIRSTKKTQSATPHFFQLGLLSAFLHCHYCWIHRWWPSSTHAAMKCQLRDLQLLAIVELGESCSSAFSKGHNVIISHLRRERQREFKAKNPFCQKRSSGQIWSSRKDEKTNRVLLKRRHLQTKSAAGWSWDVIAVTPFPQTNREARFLGEASFCYPSFPAKRKRALFRFSHVQQHLEVWEVAHRFCFPSFAVW